MLPSNPLDTQIMLHTVSNNAKLDKVNFNATKSDIIIYNNPNAEKTEWEIGSDKIERSKSTTHLGLVREDNNKFDIQPKIQVARRTMYSLMGAGLHGRRGLNPLTSYKIWECFGLPRATYGLESVKLTRKDIENIEKYQRGLLRQLQSLPDRCANIPVYTLLGAKPIEVVLDIRRLSFFTNMIRQKDNIEFKVISRQLAVKDEDSTSFTVTVRKTFQKYNLPSAYELINNTPSKEQWKAMVKEATNKYYKNNITEELKRKSTLKHLSVQENPLDEPHAIYKYVGSNPHEAEKAAIKPRLLTGTYTLQANRHKYNQHEVDATCEMCKHEAEDREHFILHCTTLSEAREKHLPKLLELVPEITGRKEDLLQLILDSTHENLLYLEESCRKSKLVPKIEQISRNLLYELHINRTQTIARKK
ncbi:hypothetical protein FSP39_014918 [Pinctada imbricata]|uniref:Uncharacterized protein n=1 Tax=Pinctada imbricata TaxID=66713 RepID=A0AA88XMG6_PINIB|nr:hypothetical protein FSP39_014918 [Pinctada imbricata]